MAVHTINSCLDLVENRLDEARKTISVRVIHPTILSLAHLYFHQLVLQVHEHAQAAETRAFVKDTGVQMKETSTMVKELHAHLIATAAPSQPAG